MLAGYIWSRVGLLGATGCSFQNLDRGVVPDPPCPNSAKDAPDMRSSKVAFLQSLRATAKISRAK